ncbi:30S ribosomal protein S4 [Candidatus Parcubacteria bacterium]|nr:MAG: 30S ribosomal protein S4 [Candidatus Parcubacteria bacterium]GIW68939.1 MAG: 30S ribosomal protein S4 [Candidatus Parcubacteria bacterium]
MKLSPKFKVCRRLGPFVLEQCQTPRFEISASRKGVKVRKHGSGRPSTYGLQLLEKQRVRVFYGVSERQLRVYVRRALAQKQVVPLNALLDQLERRLDNVVYRVGLAPTRRAARQMVSHGHITVNGRKVTIPSYQITPGDVVSVRQGSRARTLFSQIKENPPTTTPPAWLQFDFTSLEGSVIGVPTPEVVDLPFQLGQVIEFYSR